MTKTKNDMPVWVFAFLGIFILIGLALLFFGIYRQSRQNRLCAGYRQTVGVLTDYIPGYSDDGVTYYLAYSYNVGGTDYTVLTDYSTGTPPDPGSKAKIKFDPADPQKRIIAGTNGNFIMMMVGAMFTAIPAFMLYVFIAANRPGKNTSGINYITLFASLIMIFIAAGFICLIAGSFKISEIISFYTHSFFLPMIIPLIMIAGGLLGCISALQGRYYTGDDR